MSKSNPVIVLENYMLVDFNLLEYMEKHNIQADRVFSGLTWATDEVMKEHFGYILSGEKKHLMLATSYIYPEYLEEVFETIHTNVSEVSIIVYESNAEIIIIEYQKKYPNIKFNLLNNAIYD